jgi:hypothetical protein
MATRLTAPVLRRDACRPVWAPISPARPFVRVTLAEARVFCVGVSPGRGDGSGSRMQVAQGGCRCASLDFRKLCWLCEGALVSNGINARIIRPSHGLPSVKGSNSVGVRKLGRQPNPDTRSRFQRRARSTHRLFQPPDQRGPVMQIKPLSQFGTLVLVLFSGRAAR